MIKENLFNVNRLRSAGDGNLKIAVSIRRPTSINVNKILGLCMAQHTTRLGGVGYQLTLITDDS